MNFVICIVLILICNIKYANHYQNVSYSNEDEDIDISFRILQGHKAKKMYPFMVTVNENTRFECGGSIIAPKWILTAAHCLYYREIKNIVISPFLVSTVRGIMQLNKIKHETHRMAESIHVHSKFESDIDKVDYDIALIKVRIPYYENTVVKLATFNETEKFLKSTAYCTIMGWGMTEMGHISNDLKEVAVRIYRGQNCVNFESRNSILCIKSKFGGAYYGDSGGPLICNGLLYGVCSGGNEHISRYTRVDYYLDWIDAKINSAKTNKCIANTYLLILFIIVIHNIVL